MLEIENLGVLMWDEPAVVPNPDGSYRLHFQLKRTNHTSAPVTRFRAISNDMSEADAQSIDWITEPDQPQTKDSYGDWHYQLREELCPRRLWVCLWALADQQGLGKRFRIATDDRITYAITFLNALPPHTVHWYKDGCRKNRYPDFRQKPEWFLHWAAKKLRHSWNYVWHTFPDA